MDLVNSYFDTLIFLLKERRQGYDIYVSKISSGLAGHSRYVILYSKHGLMFKSKARITEIPWETLQTRTLQSIAYDIPEQAWRIPYNKSDILLTVSTREQQYSQYSNPSFPFEVLLLNDPKKKTIYQYNNKIMLSAAIDTFNLLLRYTGPKYDMIANTEYDIL